MLISHLFFRRFNTQPPEGGWEARTDFFTAVVWVSTHSRPKAAGDGGFQVVRTPRRFNTQPPEGGWDRHALNVELRRGFNTQPPEGGWEKFLENIRPLVVFQHTAARRRLGAPLKSLAPSGFAAPISLGSQEKREHEYNTALSVTPAFAIS